MVVPELRNTLGIVIKTERSALGISQEELAERAGLHRTYVSDVERGARNPSIASVEKLAQALKLPIGALFDRTSHRSGSRDIVEILLVEDNSQDVELAVRAFERARIINPLHIVRDGAAALEFLFATGTYLHRSYAAFPNLILLGLTLPDRSGLEVLQRIRADELTKKIPVIVLIGIWRNAGGWGSRPASSSRSALKTSTKPLRNWVLPGDWRNRSGRRTGNRVTGGKIKARTSGCK